MMTNELQMKLDLLLKQREDLSAEIAGARLRLRRLKKASKTGAPPPPTRAQLEAWGRKLASGGELTEEELAAFGKAQLRGDI